MEILLVLDKAIHYSTHNSSQVDRIRYLEKLANLAQDKVDSVVLEESDLREQESRWPAFFEVSRRIEGVHETIIQSSQVCFNLLHDHCQFTREFKTAVNALYADDLMTRYYAEHNQLTEACEEMAQQLNKILCVLQGSGKHVVRILEIGAGLSVSAQTQILAKVLNVSGTGTLTRHIVPILGDHTELVVEYTVTDVSFSLVADLVRSLRFGGLIPKAYDVTKDPSTQGLSPEGFDVIIAYQVLHVAPDLKVLGQRLHDLLVPGGFLLATEMDNTSWSSKSGTVWMDFTFGSFSEWFNYRDDRDHCSMVPQQWNDLFQSTGFRNFTSITGSCHSLDFIFSCQASICTEREAVERPPNFTLFRYRVGQELELQERFRSFSPLIDGIMCLWADNEYDNDSAMGLVITLAKEFPTWTIWLAMFGGLMDVEHAEAVVKKNHLYLSRERLVHFSAEGAPLFPRVVRLPLAPVGTESQVAPTLPKDHLMVQVVEYIAEGGFIGRVVQSHDPQIPEQSVVAGLTADTLSRDFFKVHSGSVVQVPLLDPRILLYLPAIVIQFHILELSRSLYPTRNCPPLQVLISLHNFELQNALRHLLELSPKIKVLTEVPEFLVDAVVTDHDTLEKTPLLEQSIGTSGRLTIWSSQLLKQTLTQEPWIWRDILNTGIRNLNLPPTDGDSYQQPSITVPASNFQAQNMLLDHEKAYVLIGGIGGIGLHLAVWLHKVCVSADFTSCTSCTDNILLEWRTPYLSNISSWSRDNPLCGGHRPTPQASILGKPGRFESETGRLRRSQRHRNGSISRTDSSANWGLFSHATHPSRRALPSTNTGYF